MLCTHSKYHKTLGWQCEMRGKRRTITFETKNDNSMDDFEWYTTSGRVEQMRELRKMLIVAAKMFCIDVITPTTRFSNCGSFSSLECSPLCALFQRSPGNHGGVLSNALYTYVSPMIVFYSAKLFLQLYFVSYRRLTCLSIVIPVSIHCACTYTCVFASFNFHVMHNESRTSATYSITMFISTIFGFEIKIFFFPVFLLGA